MTKPTVDKIEGKVFMHDHVVGDIKDLTQPVQFKGEINIASDFPTLATVQNGWMYIIKTDVTDDDATKTNTGQSFLDGDEIVWNGTDWSVFGNTSSGGIPKVDVLPTPAVKGDVVFLNTNSRLYVGVD